jgi:plastocyanin
MQRISWQAMAAAALFAAGGAGAADAAAQSTLERTPNLAGGWTGAPGVVQLHVIHRFNHSGPPARQVTNRATFLLAAPVRGALAGVSYATRSELEGGVPNEWEPFVRAAWRPISATAAYNAAVRAPAAEIAVEAATGRLRGHGVLRVLGGTADAGVRTAAGGGVVLRLGTHAALAADALALTDRNAGERIAFGAGLQLRIPDTPHTLSIQATNTASATLFGASSGSARTSYGFEFTIPFTLRRYFGSRPARPPAVAPALADAGATAAATGDTVVISMRNLVYAPDSIVVAPGTVVVWRNDDPLEHTATADDGAWDSGDIAPGAVWRRVFAAPGRYPYHCTPHPFMTGVVVVR